jgi:hypothetical protein
MIWPFNKISRWKSEHVSRPIVRAGGATYVSRANIEVPLAGAVARGESFVLYGPSHQGKTMLLSRFIPSDAIVIECRPDFKRAQIYRVILSSLGYAVLVEKKRSGKASTTVKFGVGAFGGKAGAEAGLEQTMQPVTVDLKNSSEVALLISRLKDLPWLVLNNFQLLDIGTKRALLFDLSTFADRPEMRIMVVGSWPNEDYLEELEPALAGRFHYLEVPMWSNDELREAAAQWISNATKPCADPGNIQEFLELAAGDISLFRSLMEISAFKSDDAGNAADGSSAPSVQEMVLGRFRRGLSTKLQAIYAERDSYVGYLALQPETRLALNPKFTPTPGLAEGDYLRTSINPETGQPFANGREVLLDKHKNTQYIELPGSRVVSLRIEIVQYLFRQFHAAVQQGFQKIDLATLVQEFENYPKPSPVELETPRLKAALLRFGEVQRVALVVPALLNVDSTGKAMEIADRRFFLFLQGIAIEDLIELLESARPRQLPTPRRRNQISREMTQDEKAAYVTQESATISP